MGEERILSDKERVLVECPDAFAEQDYNCWVVFRSSQNREELGYGDSEDEAWGEAAEFVWCNFDAEEFEDEDVEEEL